MKKNLFRLLLLWVAVFMSSSIWADVTFKFKAPSSWSKCQLWAWDDEKNQIDGNTSWPGNVAMTLGSDGYYTYTLTGNFSKVNFLFNNGASSSTQQTVDCSTTKTAFQGKAGSQDSEGKYAIIEETFVPDTPDTPDTPQVTGDVVISAIRNRLSINTNNFTDFAGLYVSTLPKAGDATVSYEWQFSANGTSWAKYAAGDGATWDNIRPNAAGYYRCVLSYDLAGEVTTYTSNTLQITNSGGSSVNFSSKLPVVLVRTAKDFPNVTYLDNDGVAEMKAKRSVDVKILWNEEGGAVTNADINNADMLHYDRKARMNYRGSSSLRNSKKSYAFVSGDKNCDPKKLGEVKTKKFGMFGEAAHKDWVLYASAPDDTYMRNILSFHQYAQMTGLWGVKCRYVELYIDGEYKGIYVFMDKVTQDENRVNVNEDTGYIVKFDKTDMVDSYDGTAGYNEDYKRNTFLTANTGKRNISTYDQYVDQAFEIEYPEREDIAEFDDDGNVVNDAPWEAKVAEIKGMFTNMESAILANDYAKLATLIDYDSWADWFIMNEFSRNADAYRISCVFTINSASEKIIANPIWDYELGWGNQDTKTSGLMVEDTQYYSDDFPTPFWWTGNGKSGCNGILGDCKFRAKVKERMEMHFGTDGALNTTVLNAKIDSLKTVLSGSSTSTSVSTSSLKSWVTNRTNGLKSVVNAWEGCSELNFALVGTINGSKITAYNNGIKFTEQADGSFTASFTATATSHTLQIITNTGDIWARGDSKNIVSTDENSSSYASMTKGETTGYANITTTKNTTYTFTFKLNADGVSGKLTYTKGATDTPDTPDTPVTYTELYLKGAITSWGDDEKFRLNTTDGNYYVVSYPAGEEVEISGEFKLASSDWSTLDFGGSTNTPAIEVGKEYKLTVAGSNLQASGVIKASKIEFTVSTKTLKITGVEDVYDVEISAIRNRYAINPRDFTDFAGLYVSKLPKAGDATVSYEWQFASSGSNWVKYAAGDGAGWDNIRPNTAGYYRCVLTYDLAGVLTTYTSNVVSITDNSKDAVTFSSKLPVILVRTSKDFPVHDINTQGYPNIEQVEALKAKRSVDVKILWNENGGSITQADINNADVLHYDRKARMNYRGSSSLYNPKRSYAFVSGDKNCDAKKLGEVKTKKFGMFGEAAHKDWVLYASYPDATYMRNVLTYHQYAQMTGMWGVKCRYVELYIDGEYQGIYVFMDKITQDENRININEDTGYIVKFDKTDIADRYAGKAGANEDAKRCTFTTANTGKTGISTYNITVDQAFEIEYPEREDIAEFDDDGNVVNDAPWDAKVAEIKGMFENMERAILANDYDQLATLIDYDSWADYFIMNEFSRNADAYRISCVFTVNSASDKIVANPMWDYELGWGNQDTQTEGLMVEDSRYYNDDFPTPFWWTGKGKSGCDGILGDCKFRAKVQERLEKHYGANGALNSTVLNTKIDSLQTVLRSSSKNTSVSTSSLKSWVTNRTSGLKSAVNAWEVCPEPDPYTVTPTLTHVTCNGDNNGAIALEVTGSVAPYTYTWTCPNGSTATTKDLAGIPAGVYSLKIEDSIGLTYETSYTITQPETLALSFASVVSPDAYGATNGAITTSVSGGTAPYTYSWTGEDIADVTAANQSNLKAGEYSVTVTDANGCQANASVELTQPDPLPYVVTPTLTHVTCYGDANGAIALEVSGSVAPYTYTWTYPNGSTATTKDLASLTAGVYSLKIEDSIGLTFEASYTITEPDALSLSFSSVVNPDAYGAANGAITTSVSGGTAPYTYSWTGKDIADATAANQSNLKAGEYSVTVTDANGCQANASVELTQPDPLPYTVTPTLTHVTCNGDNNGAIALEVSGSVAPYTYTWTYPNGSTATTQDLAGIPAGVYSLKIEDSIGLTYETSYTIIQPEALTLSFALVVNPDAYGATNGAITTSVSGGTAPYTYSWTGEGIADATAANQSNLKAGEYSVIVTDANGCQTNASVELTQPDPLPYVVTPTLTHVTCNGDNNGAIALEVSGSVAPYTYTWTYPNGSTATTKDLAGIPAGVYSLKIEDSIGLTYETSYTITQPEALALSFASVVSPDAYGATNGAITTSVSGGTAPYTYSWTGEGIADATAANQSNLKAGEYSVIVTDANGCQANASVELTQPDPLPYVVTPTLTHVTCNGDANGAIALEVSGSVAPYTYTWTYPNGSTATTKDLAGIPAGVYTLKIEDSIGLTYETSYTITQPEALALSFASVVSPDAYGATNGAITTSVIGGTAPYTYSWTGEGIADATAANQSNLKAGEYSVIVTDANGCQTNASVELTQPDPLPVVEYLGVVVDGECLDEYIFTAENDNRVVIPVEVSETEIPLVLTYPIYGNCDPTVFETNVVVEITSAGKFDVEITFNGDLENPVFEQQVHKIPVTSIEQGKEDAVVIISQNGYISVSTEKFIIYNVIGENVTVYNGNLLPGIYLVETPQTVNKVIMR